MEHISILRGKERKGKERKGKERGVEERKFSFAFHRIGSTPNRERSRQKRKNPEEEEEEEVVVPFSIWIITIMEREMFIAFNKRNLRGLHCVAMKALGHS